MSYMDKKIELVIGDLLSRITDFQLQTSDNEFLFKLEELRGYLVDFKGEK